ncbi:MAG TPA: DNA translocase FtsK [Candidatus Limiplasma sp.]|nr:DNA translocase FtsK [Candidatus Limiplasma sp.]
MAKKRRSRAKNYTSDTILFRNTFGILIIAIGVFAGISVMGLLKGNVFLSIRHFVQGLGGILCLGVPIYIIWSGIIVILSAYRKTSPRAFLLLLLVYLFVLGIINLLSSTKSATLMDYFTQDTENSYTGVLAASYQSSVNNAGGFGGMLGMLTAWPLFTYIGRIGGVIVLALLSLLCLLFFSRFDFIGSLRQAREGAKTNKEQRALEKSKQAHLKKLEQQQMQEEKHKHSLNFPAFLRRKTQPEDPPAAQTPPQQQQPAPVRNPSPVRTASTPVAARQPVRPMPQTQPPHPPVTLYDETIVPETPVPKTKMDADASKMLQRMDEIRKRKAQIARQIGEEPAAIHSDTGSFYPAEEDPPQESPQDRYSAYKGPKKKTVVEFPPSGKRLDDPKLILPDTKKKPQEKQAKPKPAAYPYPMIELLDLKHFAPPVNREEDAQNIAKLEETLASFDIPAVVQRVTHGPAVTRYELGLTSSGVNVKKILGISETIALQLAANGQVRIEVPIPGTNLFGIEVPNREISSVSLAEVLTSSEMERTKATLPIGLGKDIAGRPVICDLDKMPHLLIAGQTGSGKSVCINTIINSLLFRKNPQELRMILIDPKVVELQGYNEIPHLLIPVVTDPHKAAGALAWAVQEMLDRYHKMQSKGVRNIASYNARRAGDEPALPRIVVIIDELSDLMIACKREVEDSIIRLAQLARAAGIHVIIATQRPTVNVITGLIKANFPSRISFAVASSIDSRTILDANGAEKLLGSGDMFYYPTGSNAPIRVQGCYVSDQEIRNVVSYIVNNSETDYNESIHEIMDGGDTGLPAALGGGMDSENDNRLAEAVEMVLTDGQASISMLQRRMKIGYARAGRLIDEMASRGIISQSAGPKPRDVLMSYEQYMEQKDSLLG